MSERTQTFTDIRGNKITVGSSNSKDGFKMSLNAAGAEQFTIELFNPETCLVISKTITVDENFFARLLKELTPAGETPESYFLETKNWKFLCSETVFQLPTGENLSVSTGGSITTVMSAGGVSYMEDGPANTLSINTQGGIEVSVGTEVNGIVVVNVGTHTNIGTNYQTHSRGENTIFLLNGELNGESWYGAYSDILGGVSFSTKEGLYFLPPEPGTVMKKFLKPTKGIFQNPPQYYIVRGSRGPMCYKDSDGNLYFGPTNYDKTGKHIQWNFPLNGRFEFHDEFAVGNQAYCTYINGHWSLTVKKEHDIKCPYIFHFTPLEIGYNPQIGDGNHENLFVGETEVGAESYGRISNETAKVSDRLKPGRFRGSVNYAMVTPDEDIPPADDNVMVLQGPRRAPDDEKSNKFFDVIDAIGALPSNILNKVLDYTRLHHPKHLIFTSWDALKTVGNILNETGEAVDNKLAETVEELRKKF